MSVVAAADFQYPAALTLGFYFRLQTVIGRRFIYAGVPCLALGTVETSHVPLLPSRNDYRAWLYGQRSDITIAYIRNAVYPSLLSSHWSTYMCVVLNYTAAMLSLVPTRTSTSTPPV